MSWYKRHLYAQNLQQLWQTLNVSPEVITFVDQLLPEQKQYYINVIRKNPRITIQELQSTVQIPTQKQDPYFLEEYGIIKSLPPQTHKWLLVELRKTRQGRTDIPFRTLLLPSTPNVAYFHLADRIRRWRETHELADFLNANPQIRVESYTTEDLDGLVHEWHKIMAGKGEGVMYGPTDKKLVVYGPQWKAKENKNKQGWTIQEVRAENDLLAEGNKMQNCVGDYCKPVQKGKTRIFSLRDPGNEPHITVEMSPDMTFSNQIQGPGNSTPKPEFQSMIKEWISSLGHTIYTGDEDQNAITDGPSHEYLEDINTRLEQLAKGTGTDEYGLVSRYFIRPDDFENLIDFSRREHRTQGFRNENDYRGAITESPELFVDAVLKQDGPAGIAKLEEELSRYEGKKENDMDLLWNWESFSQPPNQEDFETEEEYQVAYDAWEQQEQENQDEAINEARRESLPWGFIDDTYKRINQLREKGILPKYEQMHQKQEQVTAYFSLDRFKK